MALPSVSLVLATWNGGGYLVQQLTTLARQTVLPKELVVSDDESSDRTMSILEKFARTAPFPVHVSRQPERVGYERNFADAGVRATGDLIMFVDQDDLWHPRKIERFAGFAAQTPARLLVHDLELFQSESGETLIPSFFGQLASVGLPRDVCVHGCALAIRRGLIEQWGWPPEGSTVSHDCWFGLLASATGDRAFSDNRLIRHRIHHENTSGWIPQPEDRVPELAALLAADEPIPFDGMLEVFIRSWRRDWIAPLQAALRDHALAEQREAAARAIRKLDIVDRWLEAQPADDPAE
jgi:glycosyltransferase involved in cell wall biosynthesis